MSAARAALHRLRRLGEALGLGPLAVAVYHRPVGTLRAWARAGGPGGVRRLAAARQEMRRAAGSLPPLPPRGGPTSEVVFLTGEGVWEQTLFCFVSLYRHVDRALTPVLYDDGTLSPAVEDRFRRVVPWVRVVTAAEAEAHLDRVLPEAAYPTLRARRRTYVHLRKLVDVRAPSDRPRLVLDSDLLFFRRPDAILSWLDVPEAGLYMQDVRDAYGYSASLLRRLAGGPVRPRVNVGVCGLRDPEVDWDRVEAWGRELEEREGAHYFLEQALTALWLSVSPASALPADEYVLRPRAPEVDHPEAVMHHYVLDSRRCYVEGAWRPVAAHAGAREAHGMDSGAGAPATSR